MKAWPFRGKSYGAPQSSEARALKVLPEDAEAFGDDDEGLLVVIVGVDVADGRVGQLQGEVMEPFGQVVA